MVRSDLHDPALCEELKSTLARLQASRVAAPAATEPGDANTLAPDPPRISSEADTEAEIARIQAALREHGCEDD
jgi:hypothetical protein